MYYFKSDININSKLGFEATAKEISDTLEIPLFKPDMSGRYEENSGGIFTSKTLGLNFMFCKPKGVADDEYGLSVDSRSEVLDYSKYIGKDVDITEYLLLILKTSKSLEVSAG